MKYICYTIFAPKDCWILYTDNPPEPLIKDNARAIIRGVLPLKVNEQMIDFRADYDMIDMSSRRIITGCYHCTRINNLFIVKEQYNE